MKKDVQTARKLFGEMCVHKGYCSRRDVDLALDIQKQLVAAGEDHKLLGLILLQEAMIDNAQFIDLLKELDTLVHDDDVDGIEPDDTLEDDDAEVDPDIDPDEDLTFAVPGDEDDE
jgi:hypothetical protein